jgi:hypothetical protein
MHLHPENSDVKVMWNNNKLYVKEKTVVFRILHRAFKILLQKFSVHHTVPAKRETKNNIFISL